MLRDVLGERLMLVLVALLLGGGHRSAGPVPWKPSLVGPLDPASIAAAAATLGVVTLLAAVLPAIRATRIHRAEALRAG